MNLPGFGILHQRAGDRRDPIKVAVVGAADRSVLEAFRTATDLGWVTPTMVGPSAELERLGSECAISLGGFRLLNAESSDDQAVAGVLEVREGRASLLAKGMIPTPSLMNAVLDPDRGLRTGRVVSQVVLMEIIDQDRRFLMADTGISVKPKLATKREITRQAVEVARALGLDGPRVAVVAASETVNASMPETLDAAELRRLSGSEEFAGVSIQGPLSFDLAYSSEAGVKKRVEGEVVGAADILIFPDLLSANLTVKAIMYTASCRFGGVLGGTSAPIAFMSRADDAATRRNSLALALAMLPN